MNFNQSSSILKKINALHDSATSFDGKISSMERDLLLHYLRELYEVVSDGDQSSNNSTNKTNETPTHNPPVERPAEPVVQQTQQYTPPAPPTAPVYQQQAAPVNHVVQNTAPPAPQYVPAPPTSQAPKIEVKEEAKVDKSILRLFDEGEDHDMGSRFTNLPIADIGKSMGINDKILTKNVLFSGDTERFNKVIGTLNGLKSFDDAKEYLITEIAQDEEWGSATKVERAEAFIKIVRRRYL